MISKLASLLKPSWWLGQVIVLTPIKDSPKEIPVESARVQSGIMQVDIALTLKTFWGIRRKLPPE